MLTAPSRSPAKHRHRGALLSAIGVGAVRAAGEYRPAHELAKRPANPPDASSGDRTPESC
jgi:hypothetical protein